MRLRRLVQGAAAAALIGATSGHAACQLGLLMTLPVTMQGLTATTIAQINGVDTPFLVDSGAFYSVITPGNAKRFGLRLGPVPPGFYMSGIGGSTVPSIATVHKFGVAGQSFDTIEFLVGGSEYGQDSGGLIGLNILGYADTEFDLAHGLIRLLKPSGCVRADFPFWRYEHGASEVPIDLGANALSRHIMATASVNGTSIRVAFDTGAAGSVLSLAAAKRAGIDVDGPDAKPAGTSSGLGRKRVRSWIVPVASFKIGDEEIQKTRLRVIDALSERSGEPDMLLGADFFLSHHIYVAKGLHRLYLTYNGGNVFNLKAIDTPPPAVAPGSPAVAQAAAASATASASPGPAATLSPPAAAGEPVTAEDLARRGAASAARHEYGAAIADLTKAIGLAPAEPRYLSERAAAYAGNRQPYLAMADYDAALKLAPNDVPTLMRRAEARFFGRDRAGAAADLAAADAAAPKEADVRFVIGQVYERLDDLPAAIRQYDLWLAVHRDDSKAPAAFNARCWARALLGTDLDLAEKDCAAAHRADAANPSFLDSRGLVRLRRGDYDHAIADYDAALARNPRIAWSLYGRGLAKLATGATEAGNADLAAARAIAPELPTFARKHGIGPAGPGSAAPASPAQ